MEGFTLEPPWLNHQSYETYKLFSPRISLQNNADRRFLSLFRGALGWGSGSQLPGFLVKVPPIALSCVNSDFLHDLGLDENRISEGISGACI